jgi:RNA polymerase sigma factor (sigma-70 family)
MSASTSITVWIEALRDGDPDAAERIWNHFHRRLIRFAHRQLRNRGARAFDEEDVVVDVFDSLFRRMAGGEYPEVSGEKDLWRLLYAVTANKAKNQVRGASAEKRGGGAVRGDSVFLTSGSTEAGFDHLESSEPTPEDIVLLRETIAGLLGQLPDEHRSIAVLKMQAYSNAEIAEQLRYSLATLERRLKEIRERWQAALDEQPA